MFFAHKKLLGRTETRTREMYCHTIRTVRDISRDDRARIATCSLRTPTDRLRDNYSIDVAFKFNREVHYTNFALLISSQRFLQCSLLSNL